MFRLGSGRINWDKVLALHVILFSLPISECEPSPFPKNISLFRSRYYSSGYFLPSLSLGRNLHPSLRSEVRVKGAYFRLGQNFGDYE
jgi:hypothetical protein